MKKLNSRERILALFVLVAIPLTYFGVVDQQQSKKIQELKSSVQTKTQQIQTDQITLTGLESKAALAKKDGNSQDDLQKYLSANNHLSTLLKKLGADEEDRGLTLKSVSIKDNKRVNSMYQSTMTVEVESSFVALGNFLGALSDNETLIEVKSVALNRIDNDLKRCSAVIEVNGYYNEGPKL